MAQIRKPKHPDVSSTKKEEYTPKPGPLLQRGNYALFRILSIIAAAGPTGIPTVALLQQIGTKTSRTNAIIRKAHEVGYIDRIRGERPGPGQFAPIFNILTDKGRRRLLTSIAK